MSLITISAATTTAHSNLVTRMNTELVNNTPKKGPWDNYHPTADQCVAEIQDHLDKLKIALRNTRPALVGEFCADIGNVLSKTMELYGAES